MSEQEGWEGLGLLEASPHDFPRKPKDASRTNTKALKDSMRVQALEDNFYLATVILGYEDLTPYTHGALCAFLDRAHYNRRMILMPRTTFKTTIGIVVDSIRLVCRDSNIRILVLGDNDTNAGLTLGEISNHFKYNELFQWLFPELIPDNFNKAVWNSKQIKVPRTRFWKEPTVMSAGAFGGVESKHFDHIKADDLVVEKHIHSDVEMQKLNEWVGGLEPLLIHEGKRIDFIGSRKKKGDSYEHVQNFYSDTDDGKKPKVTDIGPYAILQGDLAIFSRSIEEKGKLIFPERFGWKYINRMKKKDPERYHAQLANNPKASGLNWFREEDLHTFPRIAIGSQSSSGQEYTRSRVDSIPAGHIAGPEGPISPWSLDRILLYDPSVAEQQMSSQQALLVVGKGDGPIRYILDGVIGHFPPDEAIDALFELDREWRPSLVSVERRGFQGSIKYWLDERAEHTGDQPLPIVEWPPPEGKRQGRTISQMSKTEHIRGLQPLVRSGYIWISDHLTELKEQFEYYPNVRWDDGLDCLAQGLDYWPYQETDEVVKGRQTVEDQWLESVFGERPERSEGEWNEDRFLQSLTASGYATRN